MGSGMCVCLRVVCQRMRHSQAKTSLGLSWCSELESLDNSGQVLRDPDGQ